MKPLDPCALKSILDDADVQVSARRNHSQRGEEISFGITWTILLQSQGSIKLREDELDVGTLDKVVEMRPPFKFIDKKEFDKKEHKELRERVADSDLADMCTTGALNGELFYYMKKFYKTLDRSICSFRVIVPTTPKSLGYRAEAEDNVDGNCDAVKKWMTERLEYCEPKDAAPTRVIHEAMKDRLGKIDPSRRTMSGIGPRVWQYRGGPKETHHD